MPDFHPQRHLLDRRRRKVLFVGKSMSRSRCTGGLVDALEQHGFAVKWLNMATLRRWLGERHARRWTEHAFRTWSPDLLFLFGADLPLEMLRRFRQRVPVVIWSEDLISHLTDAWIDYLSAADVVSMSDGRHREPMRRRGHDNVVFQPSGFSPRFHFDEPWRAPRHDVVFVGGPGRQGQRAPFLARIARRFRLEIFGVRERWEPWVAEYPELRVCGPVRDRGYRRLCATSKIVLGTNESNDVPLYFSNRTFLTLACGGFHLTHYVPGLEQIFGDGEHLAWFRSAESCLERVEHYLQAHAERERIARAGRDLVWSRHRYYDRVGAILELLGCRQRLPAVEPAPIAVPALRTVSGS